MSVVRERFDVTLDRVSTHPGCLGYVVDGHTPSFTGQLQDAIRELWLVTQEDSFSLDLLLESFLVLPQGLQKEQGQGCQSGASVWIVLWVWRSAR